MQNFRTYQLALEFVREARKVKLHAPFKDQFERAVLSIALNLAEGSAKKSAKDRNRFYQTAFGSQREARALIEILELEDLAQLNDKLGASLFCLCRSFDE
jgi:four helix bundle protein